MSYTKRNGDKVVVVRDKPSDTSSDSDSDDETVELSQEMENNLLLNSPPRDMDVEPPILNVQSALNGESAPDDPVVVAVLPAIPLTDTSETPDVVEIPIAGPSGSQKPPFALPIGTAPRYSRPRPVEVPRVNNARPRQRPVTRYIPYRRQFGENNAVRRVRLPDLRTLRVGHVNYRKVENYEPPIPKNMIGPSRFRPYDQRYPKKVYLYLAWSPNLFLVSTCGISPSPLPLLHSPPYGLLNVILNFNLIPLIESSI
jgi:hypothetical protein